MADILQDKNFDFGWIWADNPKSGKSWVEVLEDALAKFREKFKREPHFALCPISETLDSDVLEKYNFLVYPSRYVLKRTVLLGVLRDKTTTVDA